MTSLIPATDTWTLWAFIIAGTALAIWLEQTRRWAARLSGPVLALLIAMVLSNTRVLPPQAPAYDFIETYLVPLAIPLLLFRANVVQIIRSTGRLFLAFHLSAFATIMGTLIAFVGLRSFVDPATLRAASGMMAASYTGGSVNFMAMKTSYAVPAAVADPLIVADNFVMAAMFAALLAIAASAFFRRLYPQISESAPLVRTPDAAPNLAAHHWQRKPISFLDLAKSLAIAVVIVAVAAAIGRLTTAAFGEVSGASLPWQMFAVIGTNKFVLLTAVSLVVATLFHRALVQINGPEELGTLMLYLFLFSIGLPADLKTVLVQAPLFFVFCAVIAVVNLAVTLLLGRFLRFRLEDLLLAVNANLGGAPSAAAMAISAGWPRLVLPGILIGIWGYVVGTPIGIFVMELLKP